MGFGAGLASFAKGISSGMDDMDARALRKKQEDRLAAQDVRQAGLDSRQAVEDQQSDVVFGQNQAREAKQQNDAAHEQEFVAGMRGIIAGNDTKPMQDFVNRNTKNIDGSMTSISINDDGTIASKVVNADGTLRGEAPSVPKDKFLTQMFALKDPVEFQKRAEAAAAKKQETQAATEADYTKEATKNAFEMTRDAAKGQADIGLQRLKGEQDYNKQRLDNQGRVNVERAKGAAESGGAAKDYAITVHSPGGSFKKTFSNSDMRSTYKDIYKFPDENLRFQSPVEYQRQMTIATDNAPTYERWLGKAIDSGINLPDEPQQPSNYPWSSQGGLSQNKPTGQPPTGQGLSTSQPATPKAEVKTSDYSNAKWTLKTPKGDQTVSYADVLETAKATGQTPQQVMKALGMQ